MLTLKINNENTSLQSGDLIILDLYSYKEKEEDRKENKISIKRGDSELIAQEKETKPILEIFDKAVFIPQMIRRLRTFKHTVGAFQKINFLNKDTVALGRDGWRFTLEVKI